MSNFAFGTYRISDVNLEHINALKEAIRSGVRLIDSSPNYMDGAAQRAIAVALREFDSSTIEDIEILSKFGYIQGSNLQNYKDNPLFRDSIDDVVEYSAECYHSISPTYMKNQLTLSLEALGLDRLECYLLHNPEYYLLDAIKKGIDKDDRLDEMYRRIELAFISLEREVKKGRILSYGISSNSFSLSVESDEFLPYEDLLTLAKSAALEVGNTKHSFTTIELPINILEQNGLKCAAWAKKNGLRVLANRPLNAKYDNKMFRLCEYDDSRNYYTYLNELMEICDTDALRGLYTLLEKLDENRHKFGWIGDYELFLYAQIIPYIQKSLQSVDAQTVEYLLDYIDPFLYEYKKVVAHECGEKTKKSLKELFNECSAPLQECALEFLMLQENIDYVLVGMRKASYVNQILALENK